MQAHASVSPVASYQSIPAIKQLLETANYVDIKEIDSQVNLRQFLAGCFNYYPSWMMFLYWIRGGFVRLLGMKQKGVPKAPHLTPEKIKLEAGRYLSFFKIETAEEDHFVITSADDKHLTAYLAVVVREENQHKHYEALTIVHYKHWTGPIYFNVIRPLHHLVAIKMLHAGANYQS
ncbi:hypothetical protein MASR2M15_01240 [Anaerolineales bacterium]